MSVLSISYDLYKEPGRAYEELIGAIKEFPWCHPSESVWFVETNMEPGEFLEYLKPYLYQSDKVLVMAVADGSAWAGGGLQLAVGNWFHDHLHTVPV